MCIRDSACTSRCHVIIRTGQRSDDCSIPDHAYYYYRYRSQTTYHSMTLLCVLFLKKECDLCRTYIASYRVNGQTRSSFDLFLLKFTSVQNRTWSCARNHQGDWCCITDIIFCSVQVWAAAELTMQFTCRHHTVQLWTWFWKTLNPLKPSIIIWLHFECSAPYRPNLPFLTSDIRALWCSGLSARVPECQKLEM